MYFEIPRCDMVYDMMEQFPDGSLAMNIYELTDISPYK